MREDDNFNYWPSFTDLMIILVLILILILAFFTIYLFYQKYEQKILVAEETTISEETKEETGDTNEYNVNTTPIEKKQHEMLDKIVAQYQTSYEELEEQNYREAFKISTGNNKEYDIFIYNSLTSQKLTFSDKILFKKNDYTLNDSGEEILRIVGIVIKSQIDSLQEIQISGHADTDRPVKKEDFNFQLAANRAISVIQFFKNPPVDIDPAKYLISAKSYGEYLSVKRSEKIDSNYNLDKLLEDNSNETEKSQNRRIEIELNYKESIISISKDK